MKRLVLSCTVCLAAAVATVTMAQEPTTRGQDPVIVEPFEVTLEGLVTPGEPETADRSRGDIASPEEASRSRLLERLRYECRSELMRSELTLFANGTLRLRRYPQDDREQMQLWLRELGPEEVDAYVHRLGEPPRDETPERSDTVTGEWLAECVLHLNLPSRRPERYVFGSRDVVTLDLQRTIDIAREMEELFQTDPQPPEGRRLLPRDYEPSAGDVLQRQDGVLFEVRGPTDDGSGFELVGIEQPLTVYLRTQDIKQQFLALVPRWYREREP